MPNVWGWIAARAGCVLRVVARARDVVLLVEFVARAVVALCAVRSVDDVRTFVLLARPLVGDVCMRDTDVRPTDGRATVFERADVLFRVTIVLGCTVVRETVFASRTAASAMPTPTIYAIIMHKSRFIP